MGKSTAKVEQKSASISESLLAGYITGIPTVGVVVTVSAAILGQMLGSFLVDTFGWFGVNRIPIDPLRLLGIALLVIGVLLVQRK